MFKKIFTTIIAVLLVVALACGMVACDNGSSKKDKEKSVEPSEEAFKDAYSEVVDTFLAEVDDYYALAGKYNLQDLGMSTSVSVTLSNDLNNMLRSLTGYDFSWVSNLKFTSSQDFKGNTMATSSLVSYNGKNLLSTKAIFDLASEAVYLGIPEMNSTYFKQYFGDIEGMNEITSILSILTSIDFTEVLPDKAAVKGLIDDIASAIINSIDDVDFDETEITANGVDQECVAYVVEINTDDLIDIAINVLNKLQNNKNLEKIIRGSFGTVMKLAGQLGLPMDGSVSADEVISMLNDGINQAITLVNQNTASVPNMVLGEWTSYITDKLEIIGMELDLDLSAFMPSSAASMSNATVFFANATDGSDIGSELYVEVSGRKYVDIKGDLTKSKNAISGSYDIKVMGTSYAIIELENVDTSSGYLTGAITVSPSSYLINMINNEIGGDLAEVGLSLSNPAIKFDVKKNDGEKFNIVLSVINNGSDFASLNIEGSIGKAQSITIPSNSTTDMDSWSDVFSTDKLANIAEQGGLPGFIVDLIRNAD